MDARFRPSNKYDEDVKHFAARYAKDSHTRIPWTKLQEELGLGTGAAKYFSHKWRHNLRPGLGNKHELDQEYLLFLVQLLKDSPKGIPWETIGEVLGVSGNDAKNTFHTKRMKELKAQPLPNRTTPLTEKEFQVIQNLEKKYPSEMVAKLMRRSEAEVLSPTFAQPSTSLGLLLTANVSPRVEREYTSHLTERNAQIAPIAGQIFAYQPSHTVDMAGLQEPINSKRKDQQRSEPLRKKHAAVDAQQGGPVAESEQQSMFDETPCAAQQPIPDMPELRQFLLFGSQGFPIEPNTFNSTKGNSSRREPFQPALVRMSSEFDMNVAQPRYQSPQMQPRYPSPSMMSHLELGMAPSTDVQANFVPQSLGGYFKIPQVDQQKPRQASIPQPMHPQNFFPQLVPHQAPIPQQMPPQAVAPEQFLREAAWPSATGPLQVHQNLVLPDSQFSWQEEFDQNGLDSALLSIPKFAPLRSDSPLFFDSPISPAAKGSPMSNGSVSPVSPGSECQRNDVDDLALDICLHNLDSVQMSNEFNIAEELVAWELNDDVQ